MTNLKLWKTLSREKVFSSRVFDVFKNASVSPRNGRKDNFFVIKFPRPWVNIVAITPDDKMVMIRQFRHGSEQIELEIPGGLVEKNEALLAAGERELKEETGFVGENARIIGKVSPNPALQENWCHTIFVENAVLSSDLALDENEDIETLLLPVSEIEKLVRNGSITHGLVLNALSFYFALRNNNF